MLSTTIYSPEMFVAENELAFMLARLAKQKVQKIEPQIEGLKHKQPEAVTKACENAISILTGPAGTGKTTTGKMIVESFIKAGMRGIIAGPTGKASKRADEVLNQGRNFVTRIPAGTTHAVLEFDGTTGEFRYNRRNKLPHDFIFLDEFSMQELIIARDLVEAIDFKKTRIVLSGDQYQLPSVGPGNVARDVVRSGVIPATELDVVLRTGAMSGITLNANRILRGLEIEKKDPATQELFTDFFFVARDEEQAVKDILKWITKDIPLKRNVDPIKDIQLMCPGKRGLVGTIAMNAKLREILNPDNQNSNKFAGFRVGDRVINNKNNKKLSIVNGDVGFVKDIIRGQDGSHALLDLGSGAGPNGDGLIEMKLELLEHVKLAYALTVHKFQGSEVAVGILPIFPCHTILLTRNLLYTGLTRAKAVGTLVGDIKTLNLAIKNTRPEKRQTGLMESIRREFRSAG